MPSSVTREIAKGTQADVDIRKSSELALTLECKKTINSTVAWITRL
jgi:hypothetical protein